MFMGLLLSCKLIDPSTCVVDVSRVFPTRAACEAVEEQEGIYNFSLENHPGFMPVEYYCHEWKWEFPNA